MGKKTLPLKEISIETLYNSPDKIVYEVPIYQRNYAWEKDEIFALIQDVYDAFKKRSNVYFIGTLVTFHQGENIYEVIDGQQRLTTINLILNVLGIKPTNPLTYKARARSNETIKSIPKFNIDEKDVGIENGFKFAQQSIADIVDKQDLEQFKIYFQKNVHIIHYEVPRDIDLNHYFEIMNSRGEQLEKHEIIKARLVSKIVDESAQSVFNFIWENCSDMGTYIQQKYNDRSVFGEYLCTLQVESFNEIRNIKACSYNRTSINELLKGETKGSLPNPNLNDERPDSFQPIIDFPNFLLIVLKITRIMNERDFRATVFNLDDKELINEFSKDIPYGEYGGVEGFTKIFAYNLLKGKYLLDNYVVHHSKEEDVMGNNPWKLQYWYQKRGKHGYLMSLCEDDNLQQRLSQLLSMFEVSFTPRQRKNYLFYCLLFLFNNYNSQADEEKLLFEYADFLEGLAQKYFYDVYLDQSKLNDINTPRPGSFDETVLCNNAINLNINNTDLSAFANVYGDGTTVSKGVPLFVFNYLDYKLWHFYVENLRGEKSKEGSASRVAFFNELGCSDFGLDIFKDFYFSRTRRSLEHYYPQANVLRTSLDVNQINCFGNFAMIGSEANSSGSNWSPATKLIHYMDISSGKIKQVSVASLKFRIMMQICRDNQNVRDTEQEWIFEDIKIHQEKMMRFFAIEK